MFLRLDEVGNDLIDNRALLFFGHMSEPLERVLQLGLRVGHDQFVQHLRAFLYPFILRILRRKDGHRLAVTRLCRYVVTHLEIDIAGPHEDGCFGCSRLSGLGNRRFVHLQSFGGIMHCPVDISHRTVDLIQTVFVFRLLGHRA